MTGRKYQKSVFIIVFLFIILSFVLSLTIVTAATTFTITVAQGANGEISPGTSTVDQGKSKTFDITPETGYSISSLIVDGLPVAIASSYTFSDVQADHSIAATFAVNNYTLTVVQGANGVISPDTTVVSYGGSQTFTVTPNAGYSISSLIVDGSPVSTTSFYTFSNVNANHAIAATFAVATFAITVSQNGHGVISPDTTVVSYGGSQTFTVTPETGYSISSLVVDGSPVAIASSYTFNNVTDVHSISATYANKFRITVIQSSNGVVSPGSTDVNYGDNKAFSIVPSTGYSIVSLTVDGIQVPVASTYIFSNVTDVHSIYATFANKFTIMVVQGANGQISPETSTVNYGSDNVYFVAATTGYHISNVVVDGVSKGALTSYTFSNVQAAHNITASFAINQYSVTVTVGAFGSSNLASQTANWGTSLNFILTPNTGYKVSDVKINGTSIGMIDSFNINITGSTVVDVSFAVNTYDITINSGLHGSVIPGNQTVDYGASLILAISPEVGYHVADVTVNDTSVGALTSYSFSATGPTSITATFAVNTFTITVVQGSNGVISPGTTNVNYGDSSSFTVTPNSGYSIASLIVDGSAVANASSYTFSNVVAAHSITATFAVNTFTITVVQGSNGVISPGTTNVNYGDSSSFTVTPNSGYSIASLIVDGSAVANASSYTFSNVVAAHTISATFSLTTTNVPTSTANATPTPTTTRPTSTPSPEPSKTPEPVPLHDITISQIIPSAKKIQVGQPFVFEVTIKNRGTASETFNVILYGNDTIIGEQTIVALASNAEKKLSFQWDTSGLAEDSIYSIKASTSEIKNDSDPENNISTLNYVQLAENLAIPIGLGVLGGPNWIYLAIGLAGFTAASLLIIKKRKPKSPDFELRNAPSKSFQGIKEITDGGFPEAYSIMIVGGADSEKSAFCQQLASGYLKQGKSILYISYDQFPEEIRANMKDIGWDISGQEHEGKFTFLDAYSSIGGKPSKEKFFVKQPFALSELGIGMSLTLNAFGKNPVKVFLDSTSPLFTRIDPSKVVEFLQDRIAKVKAENAMFFFTVGKGTIQENFLRRLEEMVDCVIELEVQKEKKKIMRRVQFKKLRGQKQPNFDIFVDTTDELTLSLLKNPNKNHK